MKNDSQLPPWAIAFGCGLVVYLVIVLATGRNEAWDDASYYVLGLPLMCIVAFCLGNLFPSRPWRWALGIAAGQTLAALLNGSSLSLLPLAIIFMLVISTPQFIAAWIGARLARKKAAERAP